LSDASTPSTATPERLPARGGTIVWGGILVVIAALGATASFLQPADFTPEFYVWTVVIIGGVLVLAGIIGAIVRATVRAPAASAKDAAAGEPTGAYPAASATDIFTERR
jgi:hypothetical protein